LAILRAAPATLDAVNRCGELLSASFFASTQQVCPACAEVTKVALAYPKPSVREGWTVAMVPIPLVTE